VRQVARLSRGGVGGELAALLLRFASNQGLESDIVTSSEQFGRIVIK
jgi:hypothetical protein